MFTGIVEDTGTIAEWEEGPEEGGVMRVSTALEVATFEIGESIAVDGVCLTVTGFENGRFEVDLSPETLRCSTLSERSAGDEVHVERALRAGDRIGGHFVQGHVDGVGRIVDRSREGEGWRVVVEAPDRSARYLVEKGSVAVDGVSLTVAELAGSSFAVAIVPHTAEATKFGEYAEGSLVNIEVDMLGKYVERLMEAGNTDTH